VNVKLPETLNDTVILHSETLKQSAYDELVDECGLSICLSGAEGFGHAVNEAASTGAVLLLNEIEPFKEFGYKAIWATEEKPETVPRP